MAEGTIAWDAQAPASSVVQQNSGIRWDHTPSGGLVNMPDGPAGKDQTPDFMAPTQGVVAWDKGTFQNLLDIGSWVKNHTIATVAAAPKAIGDWWRSQQEAVAKYDAARAKAQEEAKANGIDPLRAEMDFVKTHGLHPNVIAFGVGGTQPIAGKAISAFPELASAETMPIPQMRGTEPPPAPASPTVPVEVPVAPQEPPLGPTEAATASENAIVPTEAAGVPETTAATAANLPEQMTATAVDAGVHKNVVDAAVELMQAGKVTRNPSVKISDQIADLLATNRLQPDQVVEVLNRHNVTLDEFANIWRQDIAASARDMGRLGLAQQKLNALMRAMSPEEQAALNGAMEAEGLDVGSQAQSVWKQLDNARRASLVVQPSTAMRNLETQLGRVGLDAYEKLIDQSLQVVTGRQAVSEISPSQTFAVQLRLFQQNKALTDEILQYFPVEQDKLFGHVMSDLANTSQGGVAGTFSQGIAKVQQGISWLNSLNRFQEYFVRRAVFLGNLENGVAEAGMPSLGELEANAALHTIPKELIQNAVGNSLEMTFAKSYPPTSLPGHFIGLVNKLPGATLPIPFPRFLMNSMEFLFDYNPTGFLKLLSSEERAAIAAGNYATINKALVGSSMLLAAYQIRNDPNLAGEAWYEVRAGERTIDIRPFNPFASYFFVADLVKRMNDGTIQHMKWQDVAAGVLSANVRAGTGLALMDQFINGVAGITDWEKAKRFMLRMGGETTSGPLTFIQPVRDVMAQFDQSERVIKDTSSQPFWGPFLRKLPYGTADFPEAELATREGPRIQQSPLLKQATGLQFNQPKNPLEAELDRLGFKHSDYAPTAGDPEADRLINHFLGPMAEQGLGALVESPAWAGMGDRMKQFVLMNMYHKLREGAVKAATASNPLLFLRLKLKTMPERERMMLEEITGQRPSDLIPLEAVPPTGELPSLH